MSNVADIPPRGRTHGSVLTGLALVLLALTWTGCEEDVVGVLGTEHPFTIYGVFTPGPDTQMVRVFPVQEQLALTRPEPLDARVMSTDLTTGMVHVWEDSITQDERGRFSYLYWAPFEIEYGHRYRLEVERSDGAMSSAEVTVPEPSELQVNEPNVASFRVFQPLEVQGSTARLIRVEVEYIVKYAPGETGETTTRVVIPYDGTQRQTDNGWRIDVRLSDDVQVLREELSKSGLWLPSYGILLTSMSMRLMVVDDAWNPPEGVFDPNVLVQPGTLSNIENGFGFLGAGYRLAETWRPDSDVLAAAGFREMDDGEDDPTQDDDDDDGVGTGN